MAKIRIAETFRSRQGEGSRAGNDSFFIRTSGCNLRCWFCDTPYASWNPEGDSRRISELVETAIRCGAGDVVLTGGEPLLWKATEVLVAELRRAGLHVTIETAGTIDRDVVADLLSLSPKLSDSGPSPDQHPRWARRHESRRLPVETMRQLIDRAIETQVKFVVSETSPLDEILGCVDRLGVPADSVWLMPEATTVPQLDEAEAWLRPIVDKHGFRLADRLHLRWYGNRRGT